MSRDSVCSSGSERVVRAGPPKSAQVTETTAAGVFSAGDVTFALFGASRSIAKFQDDHWSIQALPIGPECSEVRDFMLAKDGTIFFGTMGGLSCIGHSAYLRRGVDGRYEKLPLPDGVDVSHLYAESANAIWITSGSALYFTEPLGAVVALP